MKLLIDANNISYRLVKSLNSIGFESLHVSKSGLVQPAKDSQIWNFAKQYDFTILTFDEDFEVLENVNGFPPKVILFCTGNSSTSYVFETLIKEASETVSFVNEDKRGVLEIFGR